jgi:hypothetical protein
MPASYQNLTFRLTVTNQGLSSSTDVVVNAVAGDVTITAGTQFRTGKAEWRASGTASFPGANIVTVRTGSVVGSGAVIASVPVDALGAWTLQVRNSPVGSATTINVMASRGGTAVSPVAIRN